MRRARKDDSASQPLIDFQQVLDTGVCVPAIRAEVDARLASGDYPGVTETTRTLLHQEFARNYPIPEVQTPQEVIAYYGEEIARRLKTPGQFAALAVKLRRFFDQKAFGGTVDLGQPGYLPGQRSLPV